MGEKKEIPKEMLLAAELALDKELLPREAKELFFYAFLRAAIARYGDQSKAAHKLGITRAAISESLIRLEARI